MKKTGEGRSTVHGVVFDIFVPKRFPAKWTPVRVKKTRQNKNREPRSDSIGAEKALGGRGGQGRENRLGRMGDDGEQRPRRSARRAFALLPVPDGLDRHAKPCGEFK